MQFTQGKCLDCSLNPIKIERASANHLLHLVLSVLTAGMWIIVWILVGVQFGGWTCSSCGSRNVRRKGGLSKAFWVGVVLFCAFIPVLVIVNSNFGESDSQRRARKARSDAANSRLRSIANVNRTPESSLGSGSKNTASYYIKNREIHDSALKTQVVVKAIVSGDYDREWIVGTLNLIYKKERKVKRFKSSTQWVEKGFPSHIGVDLFQSNEHFEGGVMIGTLFKTPVSDKSIWVNEDAFRDLEPGDTGGLNLSERKHIFKMIVRIEDEARIKSEEMFPVNDLLDRRIDYQRKFANEKIGELLDDWGQDREMRWAISEEGIQKGWPMPKLR